jgi:hypothetical protein
VAEDLKNFAQLHEINRQNITPGMVKYLSDDLGVSVESLERLGVGYNYVKSAFTFPERDNVGEVIGLSYRYLSGKKGTEEGSKRGLTYILNPECKKGNTKYEAGNARWVKLDGGGGISCPICGHDNWCMVSSTDVHSPPAVNCCTQSVGSVATLGMGWLHILRQEGDTRKGTQTVLCSSSLPVLVLEGLSDVAAATDLGFVEIGRAHV